MVCKIGFTHQRWIFPGSEDYCYEDVDVETDYLVLPLEIELELVVNLEWKDSYKESYHVLSCRS